MGMANKTWNKEGICSVTLLGNVFSFLLILPLKTRQIACFSCHWLHQTFDIIAGHYPNTLGILGRWSARTFWLVDFDWVKPSPLALQMKFRPDSLVPHKMGILVSFYINSWEWLNNYAFLFMSKKIVLIKLLDLILWLIIALLAGMNVTWREPCVVFWASLTCTNTVKQDWEVQLLSFLYHLKCTQSAPMSSHLFLTFLK